VRRRHTQCGKSEAGASGSGLGTRGVCGAGVYDTGACETRASTRNGTVGAHALPRPARAEARHAARRTWRRTLEVGGVVEVAGHEAGKRVARVLSSTPVACALSWYGGASRVSPARGTGRPGRAQARQTGFTVGAVMSEHMQGTHALHERVRGERAGPMRVRNPRPRPECAQRGHSREASAPGAEGTSVPARSSDDDNAPAALITRAAGTRPLQQARLARRTRWGKGGRTVMLSGGERRRVAGCVP
jgi:hypothetical protein